ncbi:MAG: putative sugar O-methyltransferase [Tardiphaga sp.]
MFNRARTLIDAFYLHLPRYNYINNLRLDAEGRLREAYSKLDATEAELQFARAANVARRAKHAPSQSMVQHRSFEDIEVNSAIVSDAPFPSTDLVTRIRQAYLKSYQIDLGPTDNQWLGTISDQKRSFHEILLSGREDEILYLLRDPTGTSLFYGFDSISSLDPDLKSATVQDWRAKWTYDNLLRLAEAMGIIRLENPEAPHTRSIPALEEILVKLDDALGFRVSFPNPFVNEPGLKTSRGVATYRATQALYQAWKISRLAPEGAKVAEIGAGTGRTAFYTRQMGIKDYTIIDLPMTNIAQAYFLGASLGVESIGLHGETASSSQIKLLTPFDFDNTGSFDLIVNIDSMTEMSKSTAVEYFRAIKNKTSTLLSINHEVNGFTVREIAGELGINAISREAHWMRRGYTEEIYKF